MIITIGGWTGGICILWSLLWLLAAQRNSGKIDWLGHEISDHWLGCEISEHCYWWMDWSNLCSFLLWPLGVHRNLATIDWLGRDINDHRLGCEINDHCLGSEINEHCYWWMDWEFVFISSVVSGSTEEFGQDLLIRPWDQWSLIRMWD